MKMFNVIAVLVVLGWVLQSQADHHETTAADSNQYVLHSVYEIAHGQARILMILKLNWLPIRRIRNRLDSITVVCTSTNTVLSGLFIVSVTSTTLINSRLL